MVTSHLSGRVLTRPNHDRLTRVVAMLSRSNQRDFAAVGALARLLAHSHILEDDAVPADLATMNSHVTLVDDEHRVTYAFTLSYPIESAQQPAYSVLSPMGLSVLGHRAGAGVMWDNPRGARVTGVLKAVLRQPEADKGCHVSGREWSRHG